MSKELKINNTHQLGVNNYYPVETRKRSIVIGNTFTNNNKHIKKWCNRLNGEYKETAPFTIDRDGTIYQHYDPKYYSNFINGSKINMSIIPIVLENEGYLIKDLETKSYINWIGDTYNIELGVIEVKWRKHKYWAKYTDEQLNSLSILCKHLCERFDIPLEVFNHNTKTETKHFNGVLYRSNFNIHYTDVSPAFDIEEFKNKVEKK